ncbi:MAG: sigma-70 family RNA polymerase sigma factor [Acidobacteria bacterium]|nr:sigma-70 family RNA polymerase sigma factor [Acidobacteriota bacterium]
MECVQRAASGDQSGLAALYDQSSPLVFAIAVRILMDRADAEEVTVDVYSQVWRHAGSFDRRRGSVVSWLMMLARSRALDRLRTRASRARREGPGLAGVRMVSPENNPEEAAVVDQTRQRMAVALAALAPEQREVIELAYYSGYSHSQMAERLGQPVGTVKTRIRLGMMKLRAALETAPKAANLGAP